MSFKERWISGNLRTSLTGIYPNTRKVGIREHMADGYGEWIRHPLFGLWTRSCAGVYKQRSRKDGRGVAQRDKLCGRCDRLRKKERDKVLWWPTRRFDAYIPYRRRDKGSFPRSLVYMSSYFSCSQYCEMDVFIIYVNFSVGSSGTPVTKARVKMILYSWFLLEGLWIS